MQRDRQAGFGQRSTSRSSVVGRPLLEGSAANTALTRARVGGALVGVVLHGALIAAWDVTPWLLGISALHLLATSMVVADTSELFPPMAISFDMVIAVTIGVVVGDAAASVPWLVALTPFLLTVVAPRVGLALLMALGVSFGLGWAVVAGFELAPIFGGSRSTTYLVAASASVVVHLAVLVIEVGWAMRRRAEEEEIRVRELEALTDRAPIGMAVQDMHRRFVYTNPRLREIFGLTEAQISESGLAEAIPDEVLARIEPTIIEAQLERSAVQFEHAVKRPDGTVGWVDVSMSEPIRQPDGTPLFVFSVIDVSAQMSATARSRRFARALDGTSDIVVLWDTLRRPLHMNAAFRQFFGDTQSGRAQALQQILHMLDEKLPTWPSLPGGSTVEFETELVGRATAPMPFSAVITVSEDDLQGGRSFALLARDISTQRIVNAELREAVRTKDEFIAAASHALRTPLSVVLGLATEMSERLDHFRPDEVVDLAALIADQSAELAAIVENLLVAAEADAGVLTVHGGPVAVIDIVGDLVRGLGLGDEVVQWQAHATEVTVIADPLRVQQILRNLCANAVEHGGGVRRIEVARAGRMIDIAVVDAGPPISASVQSTMFDAYGRGQPSPSAPDSIGLGLTAARVLARLMGGDVRYEHDGRWSRFTLRLPSATSQMDGTSMTVDDRDEARLSAPD